MNLKFSIFPRNQSPGFVIYQAASKMKLGLQRAFGANGFEITPEQWGVMSALWEHEGVHQSLLAARTAKDRHNVTRILHLLERDGFIRREQDVEDRRLQKVYVTDEGKAMKARLVTIVTDFLQEALNGLTQEDLEAMKRILDTVVENVEKMSHPSVGHNPRHRRSRSVM